MKTKDFKEYVQTDILSMLLFGMMLTKYQIQQMFWQEHGKWVDTSSVGSRLRELRTRGYDLTKKIVKGKQGTYLYYIKKGDK